jgi:hypothetical protein
LCPSRRESTQSSKARWVVRCDLVERFENGKVRFSTRQSLGATSPSDAAEASRLPEKCLDGGGLSYAWFTGDRQDAAAAAGRPPQRAMQHGELLVASDDDR